MPTDKPARQYSKLIDDLKALQKRNRELEADALKTAGRIQDAVDTALADAKADHDTKMANLVRSHNGDWDHAAAARAELLSQLETVREELANVERSLAATEALRSDAANALLATTVRADGLAAKVAEIQPQLDLIAQQRAELTHILDMVRDRLRRKELQDERAILNRQALSAAVPAVNRR